MPKILKEYATPNLNEYLNAKLLGMAIKARRTQSGMSIEEAAALCGVAKQTFSNIEHGNEGTQLGTVLQVCNGLGIKIKIQSWENENLDE